MFARKTALLTATLVTFAFGVGIAFAEDAGKSSAIAPSAEKVKPLQPGEQVPNVTLKSTEGEDVALKGLLEDGPVVIVFYRGGWCPYCSTQLKGLVDAKDQLAELGYTILAISPESAEDAAKLANEKELTYTLLADPELAAAKAFGVAFYLGAIKAAAYKGYGLTVPEGALPVPSVFLANSDGKITFTHAEADYKVRLSNEDLIAAAKAHPAK